MRPIIEVIVLLAGFLLLSPSSYAANDGNTLLEWCADAEKSMDNPNASVDYQKAAFCGGMVEGVRGTQMSMSGQFKACIPVISNGQAIRVVLAYLRKNPARLHENQVHLVMDAFKDAYPCK